MLTLDDPRWPNLKGGYKVPYDPRPIFRRLEIGEDVWDELWQELHHQGDVGEASYAAVPHLVRIMERAVARDWHFYGLLSVIEVERHRKSNPPLPEWLGAGYRQAWSELLNVALADLKMQVDRETLRAMLSVVALAKGDVRLGAVLVQSDESEIMEILERYDAWSELYTEQGLASDAHKDARG